MRAAAAAPGLTVNPHPVAQSEAAHNFRSDKNVLRRLHKVALRIAQEPEAFARDFDDAFAEFRLSLNLFATFHNGLRGLAWLSIKGLDISNRAGRIGIG